MVGGHDEHGDAGETGGEGCSGEGQGDGVGPSPASCSDSVDDGCGEDGAEDCRPHVDGGVGPAEDDNAEKDGE